MEFRIKLTQIEDHNLCTLTEGKCIINVGLEATLTPRHDGITMLFTVPKNKQTHRVIGVVTSVTLFRSR